MGKLLSKASALCTVVMLTFSTPTAIASAPTAVQPQVPQVAPSSPSEVQDSILSNCYLYMLSKIPSLPRMADITTNTTPHPGAVAFFNYSGLPHFGIITKVEQDGFWLNDSNFGGPGIRTHFIAWGNIHIKGFWSP